MGEGEEPVLNIYISEVALIFIRAAGLYEEGCRWQGISMLLNLSWVLKDFYNMSVIQI